MCTPPLTDEPDEGVLLGEVWSCDQDNTLSESEALTVAYDELKAMRRERGDSGRAAS